MRKMLFAVGVALSLALAGPAAAQWKPTKPIRIIVPWSAGGSTDQLIRTLAADLEDALGQKVVVVNQPGGGGAVGTKAALDAPKDGYTWTSGAAKDLGTYVITGAIDTQLKDWNLFLATVNYTVLSVNPGSKFKSVEDVVRAMKSDPNSVTIATGGINSAGGAASEALKLAVGGNYKMITYDGGNPAVQSTVAHETEVTTQLVSEQYDMLRAKRLTPLAAYTPGPVNLPGVGEIPSLTKFVPNVKVGPVHFGIWVPKGVSDEVIATMGKIWDSKIKNSERLKKYAESKGLGVDVAWGEAAYKQAYQTTAINAWQIFDGGKGKVSPDKVGFSRP